MNRLLESRRNSCAPKNAVSDRMDVSCEELDEHYDIATHNDNSHVSPSIATHIDRDPR